MSNKVMLIDDDKEFLEELTDVMISNEFDVSACSDGETALKMVPKIMPDVILLDLKLGGINGFQVAAGLRRKQGTSVIPVIAMTAYYNPDENCALMNACGLKKCITKPFSPGNVILEIKDSLING